MGAKHISPAEVVEMQRLYRELGTYAAVARKMGRSASSVSKFVQMKDVPHSIRIAVENLSQKLQYETPTFSQNTKAEKSTDTI